MRSETKSKRSFETTTCAGVLLALLVASIGSHSIACPERAGNVMQDSYRSAVRMYERARTWSSIARFWVDPQPSAAAR